MTKVNTEIFQSLGEFNAGIEAAVSGIRVVQAFANEPFEQVRFEKVNQGYRKAKIKFYQVMAVNSSYNYFLIRLINLFALIFGALYTIRGEITYGDFVGFILLTNVFVRPIEKVNTMIESYPKGIAGFKRFIEEIDRPSTIQNHPQARDLVQVKGDIAYQNVTFSYSDGTPVLSNVSLNVEAGKQSLLLDRVVPVKQPFVIYCHVFMRFQTEKSR